MAGPGSEPDLGAQAEAMAKIRDLFQQQERAANRVNEALGNQLGIMQELCETYSSCFDTEKQTDMNSALEDTVKRLEESEQGTRRVTDEMQRQTDETDRFGSVTDQVSGKIKKAITLTSMWASAVAVLNSTMASFKSAGKVVSGAFGLVTRTATGLVRAVSGTMNALWGWAQGGGGGSGWREALQGVKKEFGDLSSNEGKAVMDMYKDVKASADDFGKSGTSLRRILGKNSEILKHVTKISAELRPELCRYPR